VASARTLGEWAGLRIPLRANGMVNACRAEEGQLPADAAQMLALGELPWTAIQRKSDTPYRQQEWQRAGRMPSSCSCAPLSATPGLFRREGCITAALELARRERNTALAGRILDHLNGNKENDRKRWRLGSGMETTRNCQRLYHGAARQILDEEQTMDKFPSYNIGLEPKYAEELAIPPATAQNAERTGETVDDGPRTWMTMRGG